MDSYRVATSWALFGVIATVGAYYYWPQDHRRNTNREDAHHATRARRRNDQEKQPTRPIPERAPSSYADAVKQGKREGTRKRKVQASESAESQAAPAVVVHGDDAEEVDMNMKQFAERMQQTRKGHDLTSTKSKEQRVKTVKQSGAINTPVLSSGSSQAADDDLSPTLSPTLNAGDVEDMLEPVASGPSTLRVIAPEKPQKEKPGRAPKQEVVETKKQRQNRQKVESQRQQREDDEKDRKRLEENQRRMAREARGEPARNGVPVSKPPKQNAWLGNSSAQSNGTTPVPTATQNTNGPLLDTFDAESTSSSNGGLEPSTTATSTSSGGKQQWDHDLPSEEEQLAQAMRQSEDESGWTTVAQPKKQKKNASVNGDVAPAEPMLTNKTNKKSTKPTATPVNGKPKGFQALEVQYEQRSDADPSDASNWDA